MKYHIDIKHWYKNKNIKMVMFSIIIILSKSRSFNLTQNHIALLSHLLSTRYFEVSYLCVEFYWHGGSIKLQQADKPHCVPKTC